MRRKEPPVIAWLFVVLVIIGIAIDAYHWLEGEARRIAFEKSHRGRPMNCARGRRRRDSVARSQYSLRMRSRSDCTPIAIQSTGMS